MSNITTSINNPLIKVDSNKQGLTCLGYNRTNCVIWSEPKQCIFEIAPTKLKGDETTIAEFKKIGGKKWITDNFSEEDTINGDKLANFIIESCNEKGLFTETDKQLKTLDKAIKTWAWKNPAHAKAMIGFIAQMPICGDLKWRSHAFIAAPAATGKTTLSNFIGKIFSENSVKINESTASAAGIHKIIGDSAKPVILDELSGINPIKENTLNLIRGASAGDEIIKGTMEGELICERIKSSFTSFGLNKPDFEKRDLSRHLILELTGTPNGSASNLTSDEINNLGETISVIMEENKDILIKNTETMSNAIALHADNRTGDTLGTVIACYYTLNHAEEISKAKSLELLHEFSCFIPEDTNEDISDEQKCIDFLLTQTVTAHIPETGLGLSPYSTPIIMARLIKLAAKQQGELPKYSDAWSLMTQQEKTEKTTYIQALEHFGLKAYPAEDDSGRVELFIPNNPFNPLVDIYNKKESEWQGGIFKTALTRLEGYRKGIRESFKTSSTKPTGFKVIIPVFID